MIPQKDNPQLTKAALPHAPVRKDQKGLLRPKRLPSQSVKTTASPQKNKRFITKERELGMKTLTPFFLLA